MIYFLESEILGHESERNDLENDEDDLKDHPPHPEKENIGGNYTGGGFSFNTTGSISTSVMWKKSHRKLAFHHMWNNIELDIF